MKLRDYQKNNTKQGKEILNKHNIVYLAMQTRTGKTLTALNIANDISKKGVLFVTKKKAIASVINDYEKVSFKYPLYVINYESVHKIKDDFDLIICDEAHTLGQFPKPSQRTKRLKEMAEGLPIIYLSGTPTPESFSQIFHQFWISSFSPFNESTFYKWANTYVNKKKKYVYNREINDYSEAYRDFIEPKINHLFITTTQKEAGFNKTIQEKVLKLPFTNVQSKAIDTLLRDLVLPTQDGNVILADTRVKLQNKIHQICSGTVKDEDGNIRLITANKARFIKEKFKGKKIAIFYKFIGERIALDRVFDNLTDNPEDFQKSDDLVFAAQFISGREGIRLDTADAIIFYNIDFSYLSYAQAKDRIVSKERKKEAVLYWIFTDGGIEEKIYKAVQKKSDYTVYYFSNDYGIRKQKTSSNYSRS